LIGQGDGRPFFGPPRVSCQLILADSSGILEQYAWSYAALMKFFYTANIYESLDKQAYIANDGLCADACGLTTSCSRAFQVVACCKARFPPPTSRCLCHSQAHKYLVLETPTVGDVGHLDDHVLAWDNGAGRPYTRSTKRFTRE
jgi:hypothetical protein